MRTNATLYLLLDTDQMVNFIQCIRVNTEILKQISGLFKVVFFMETNLLMSLKFHSPVMIPPPNNFPNLSHAPFPLDKALLLTIFILKLVQYQLIAQCPSNS